MNKKSTELYTMLVDFLGHALGPNYEVILQDVDKRCIVAIANSEISGRTKGAPLTDFALKIIAEKSYDELDLRYNYIGKAHGDKTLKCSTYFIKSESGALTGLLSVNCDITKYEEFNQYMRNMIGLNPLSDVSGLYHKPEPDNQSPMESFAQSVSELTSNALKIALEESPPISAKPTQAERMAIIDILNQKGVFLLKGAVTEAAEFLQCSEASVYRYLSKINRKNQNANN